ncbi:MAG TPA: helix-turn-helix domain-containing protein [Bryobacteraceae bacterium]|nr:helix-turn-helix domain-containing protein [Bryobacteraceae bacterium]
MAIYLPPLFYSGIASSVVETLQVVNDVTGSEAFSFEFVSAQRDVMSRSGICFRAKARASRKIDVLILLAGTGIGTGHTSQLLEEEIARAKPFILCAQRQGAILAATCGASYLLAGLGLLDGKRATISWWLKEEASRRFPRVRWEPSRLVVRQGHIYTTGAGFAGLELITALLVDLGFAKEERKVRKLMVLPPSRQFQTPYEMSLPRETDEFERKLDQLAKKHLPELSLEFLAQEFGVSPRTLSRDFSEDLQTSPGKWIQGKRLEVARTLLETTRLSVSEICYRVGYEDVASFSRLFSRTTGMTPGEFRKQVRSWNARV